MVPAPLLGRQRDLRSVKVVVSPRNHSKKPPLTGGFFVAGSDDQLAATRLVVSAGAQPIVTVPQQPSWPPVPPSPSA
jgi:hypothetical protein